MLIGQVAQQDPLLVVAPLLKEILLLSEGKNKAWLQEVMQKQNLRH